MIPVYEPVIGEEEITAVAEALRRGELSGTWGESIEQFESEFARYSDCEFGVAVTSGTTALHLALAAAGIGDRDEVLISSSTNIATALAVVRNGATPVPVDSESRTWNLDLDSLEGNLTSRTKAILPVHLYGHPVDMHRLIAFAEEHDLLVIEDAAEAHGATCRGRKVGSFGLGGCFSFYANKMITTGEGGMVVTNDPEFAGRLRYLRNLAFGEPRFLHHELGFNYRMTGFQAAFGLAQFRRIESIIESKRRIAEQYTRELHSIVGLRLPVELEWARAVYWVYGIVVEASAPFDRDTLMARLTDEGIESRTFFCPMNLQPCLESIEGFVRRPNPVAESLWRTGLYLPSGPSLTGDQIEYVASVIRGIART